jgi:general secretion pathway protein A
MGTGPDPDHPDRLPSPSDSPPPCQVDTITARSSLATTDAATVSTDTVTVAGTATGTDTATVAGPNERVQSRPHMYEDFYGLKALPFNITPDPRYLFFSNGHREAFEHIIFGITQKKGFIQITGEVGAGKSTICRAVLEELNEHTATALILNPVMTGIQLLRSVLRELHLDDRGNDRVRLTDRLNVFLLERADADEEVVLLIDEAQDMSPELLEQVRLLSNLETDDRKLLQIVLVGQPELRTMLASNSLRQLSQRITIRYHLEPIRRDEIKSYILHRLQVAGSNGRPSFTPAALRAIHRHSRGVPRLINAVCDKTLLCGYVEGRDRLGYWQVRRAIRELGGRRP